MAEGMQEGVSTAALPTECVSQVAGEAVLVVEGVGAVSDETVVHVDTPRQPLDVSPIAGQEEKEDKGDSSKFHGDGVSLINRKVQKRFGRKVYNGEVVGFDSDTKWYKVMYEDGDREDLWWDELEPILLLLVTPTSRKRRQATSDENKSGTKRVRKDRHQTFTNDKVRIDLDGRAEDISGSVEDEEKVSKIRDFTRGGENAAEQTHAEGTQEVPSTETNAVDSTMKPDVHSRLERKRKAEARAHGKTSSKTDGESLSTDSKRSTRRSSSALDAAQVDSGTRRSLRAKNTPSKAGEELSVDQGQPPEAVAPYLGDGPKLVGRKTMKDFGGSTFGGEIIGYDPRAKYYKVRYEDGDEEELEWSEVEPTLITQEVPSRTSNGQVQTAITSTKVRGNSKILPKLESPKKEQRTFLGQYELENQKVLYSILKSEERVVVKQLEEPVAAESAATAISASQGSFVHNAFEEVRFASANDAENLEFYGWGEVAIFDNAKCPELQAAKLLPTSSPIVHLTACRHHLAAITAAGQVWIWRNQHGGIHSRCNEWEHISDLDNKGVVLVDIAGPELERSLGDYDASQEDQVPDPFYLAAVCSNGEDFILQGSLPQEPVRTYALTEEPQHLGLKAALKEVSASLYGIGNVIQVSVGTVEEPDEPPFVGYITDTSQIYIRSATNHYMEEINCVSGFTGRPLKIQCGRAYHAIIMSDDGRAWTWGRGYFHGAGKYSGGIQSKLPSPFSVCQPALGTLVGRKVIDVGCYGEDFIALTDDGEVHQWTHAVPNPALGVYNVPATPIFGQGPCLSADEKKLKKVSIGAGMCSGISESGRVHTWQTHMNCGLVGVVGLDKEDLTPLGRDEQNGDTAILSLGTRDARKVVSVAGSLVVVVHKKPRGRLGWRRKTDMPVTVPVVDEHALTTFYS